MPWFPTSRYVRSPAELFRAVCSVLSSPLPCRGQWLLQLCFLPISKHVIARPALRWFVFLLS